MRDDFNKVITERERSGSKIRNTKTGFHEHGYDDRETKEDKYALPKRGKMLMGDRVHGAWSEDKNFTDVLGPLNKWLQTRVGKNWDKTYSELRKKFPNNNKVNHHLIETHLLGSIELTPRVEKVEKVRKVYNNEEKELWYGELYVDPLTHVLMKYKYGKRRKNPFKAKPVTTLTGYLMYAPNQFWKNRPPSQKNIENKEYYVYLGPSIKIEWRGENWIFIEFKEEEVKESYEIGGRKITKTRIVTNLVNQHVLNKKELIKYGLKTR